MWRRIRSASGTMPRPPTHPEPDMEAARLCVEFTDRSSAQNLPLSTQLILADLAPMREVHINAAIQEEHQTDRAFNLSELEMVLDGLHDTAPGADTVSYSMIKNTPLGFRHLLLRLINQSFQEGKLPEAWTTARIVPIPKPKKKGDFRPISLLPVMGKLMERMVLNRLRWTAEPLCNQTLGFRHDTGTTDAVATVLNNVSRHLGLDAAPDRQLYFWTWRRLLSWCHQLWYLMFWRRKESRGNCCHGSGATWRTGRELWCSKVTVLMCETSTMALHRVAA